MKLDVLSGLDEVRVGIAYDKGGSRYEWPLPAYEMEQVVPIYESLPGWHEDLSTCRQFDELPANARAFVEQIEAWVGIPIRYISVGPERAQTIVRS
ncbi:hypothetical protein GCM10025858_09980 [Alicyclobacillus sacchari]|nr:hypothetical protein GCM10025858_09980 [Alicyclobacillus sacchari]